MSGKLYIVPTPVGNMADMTPRAADVLREAALILAEDTRTSAPLLKRFGIDTPMLSYHKFNEHSETGKFLDRIEAGETIALISDAGTPCSRAGHADAVLRLKHCPARQHSCRLWSAAACHATDSYSKDFCRQKKAVPHAWPSWLPSL